MELKGLTIFYKAARVESFLHSGVNMSPSAIGRHISKLEHELKTKLFHRFSRGVRLTKEGMIFYKHLKKVFAELDMAQQALSSGETTVKRLTISLPYCWASSLILFYLKEFMKENSDYDFEIKGNDALPKFDVTDPQIGIYPFPAQDRALKSQCLGKFPQKLYAHKDYIAQYGLPERSSDLRKHTLISYGNHFYPYTNFSWHLNIGMPSGESHRAVLFTNDVAPALLNGIGVAPLIQINPCIRTYDLVNVLPELVGPSIPLYFICHSHHEIYKNIETLKQSLIKEMGVSD